MRSIGIPSRKTSPLALVVPGTLCTVPLAAHGKVCAAEYHILLGSQFRNVVQKTGGLFLSSIDLCLQFFTVLLQTTHGSL